MVFITTFFQLILQNKFFFLKRTPHFRHFDLTKLRTFFFQHTSKLQIICKAIEKQNFSLGKKKNTIHQVTTKLSTSKNVLFPGHSQVLATGADDPSLIITLAGVRVIIKVSGHQHRWLAGGYDLEGHFSRWLAWWLPGGQYLFCTVWRNKTFPTTQLEVSVHSKPLPKLYSYNNLQTTRAYFNESYNYSTVLNANSKVKFSTLFTKIFLNLSFTLRSKKEVLS